MGTGKKRFIQFALLAIAAGEISAASADVLILRSLGPSARQYPAGSRVPDSARFTLRPGDSVVILASGSTRTFRGPGTYSANGPANAFAGNSAQVRRQTGAVRGPGSSEVRRPADIWQFDVTQSGRACILAGSRPVLWRPSSERTVRVTITPQSGDPQTLNWDAGRATLNWPAGIPVVDGASYQISWTGGTSPTRLTAKTLAAIPANNVEAVATALLTNQCRGQLDVLIATRDAEAAAAGARSGGMPAPR